MADYSKYDKTELLKIIAKQEKELKNKKYGLVWDSEREPEQVVLDCENNLPILKRVKSKEIRTNDSEDNILIEGDNYHALTVLNYTHKEKIDVIYIDPPYNTGEKDFKYNDRYVDKEDGYRHSKWLNFMEKRLKLAKELLKQDGVIFIHIDENEFSQLKILCDSIFFEKNIIGTFIWLSRSGKGGTAGKISYQHEYILCYAKEESHAKIITVKKVGKAREEMLTQWGQEYLRENRPSMFFPILYKKDVVSIIEEQELSRIYNPKENTFDDNYLEELKIKYESQGYKFILPLVDEGFGRYRGGFNTIKGLIKDSKISVKKNKHGLQPYRIYDEGNVTESAIDSVLYNYGTASTGTKELKSISNGKKLFDTTKPIKVVKYLVSVSIENKKNAIILDFFAGSGTTGHAVLELNKEDGGNRKYILCTNNENNICTEVTYPRIHNVIKGYKFKGKDKTILFEKRLTWTDVNKNMEQILEQVNEIIEENKDNYNKIEKEFKDNTLNIIGIKNIDDIKGGLGGNLQYFKTDLIKKTKNRDQVKIDLTQKCTEMLCVKENIFNLEIEKKDYKIFLSNKTDRFLCIYYNIIDDTFDEFLIEIKKLEGKKIVYMFSIENKVENSLFVGIKNIKIKTIPQNILDVYKKLVKMNISIKVSVIFTDFNKAKTKIFADKDKDDGARILRIVLQKVIQKISQDNNINVLNAKGKEEKASSLNNKLYNQNIITKIEWEENKTFLTIGNNASHGDYEDYDLKQVENFYKHIQSLLNSYDI
jgi:adenine-specific DNA-methyltransferase